VSNAAVLTTASAAWISTPAASRARRGAVDPAIYDRDGDDANPVGLLGSEADGGFASFVVARADRVFDMDASPLSDEELACLPVAYGTATGMLERGRVTGGETVLVTGASGGVGLAAVQSAAARGATVVAVTGPGKEDPVREAGASADRCCRLCSRTSATAGGG
jgi:NADPH:quinone reductase-like Zn-dependent oxidoreductase